MNCAGGKQTLVPTPIFFKGQICYLHLLLFSVRMPEILLEIRVTGLPSTGGFLGRML